MRKVTLAIGVLCAALSCLTACKKADTQPATTAMEINGVKLDLPKLEQALADITNDETKSALRNIRMSLRYGQYDRTMADLDKLSSDTTLTDEQKKLVADVTEQMKQVLAKAPAPPAGQ